MSEKFEANGEYSVNLCDGFTCRKVSLASELSQDDIKGFTQYLRGIFNDVEAYDSKNNRDFYIKDSSLSEKELAIRLGNKNGKGHVMIKESIFRYKRPISEENRKLLGTVFSYAPISEKLKEDMSSSENVAL